MVFFFVNWPLIRFYLTQLASLLQCKKREIGIKKYEKGALKI